MACTCPIPSLEYILELLCSCSCNRPNWYLNKILRSGALIYINVVSGALMVWSWLLLVFDRLGWRRKKGQLAETFQLSVTSLLALCHIRNYGISTYERMVQPLRDTCPLLI